MKGRHTLILLLLNLLVAGVIVYLHIVRNANLATDGEDSDIFGVNLTEVDYIRIEGKELTTPRVFEKKSGEWLISEPIEWKANLHAVNRLLNQLRWLEQRGGFPLQDTLSFGQSLADFGLENPRLTVTVGQGNSRETLSIGDATSVGDRIYALGPQRDYIHVLSLRIVEALMMQMEDLRSQEVFDIPPFETNSIRIRKRQEDNRLNTTTLIREGKLWNFEAPIRARASSDLVEETLNRLTQTKAIRFLNIAPEQFAEYGVDNGQLIVRLEGNNRSEQLLIGNPVEDSSIIPQVYARIARFPTVFTIAARQVRSLSDPQTNLREKRILDFQGRPPHELSIRQGDRELDLRKQENGNWQFLQKSSSGEFHPEKAERSLLEFLVDYLNRLEVVQFVLDAPMQEDLERFGLLQPNLEITLKDPGNQTLLIGNLTEDDGLYAQKKGEPFVYKISDELLDWVTSNPLFYRDRILQKLPSGAQIQSLTIRSQNKEEPWLSWNFGEELSNGAKPSILQEKTLDLVREFRVERYIEENYWSEYKEDLETTTPWPLHLVITWSLRGGDATQVTRNYYFSELTSEGVQVGSSPELNMTFYLTREWIDLIESLQNTYHKEEPELGDAPGRVERNPLVEETPAAPTPAPEEKEESPQPEPETVPVTQEPAENQPESPPPSGDAQQASPAETPAE